MKRFKSRKRLLHPLILIADFIRLESSSGIILFVAAVIAMILANSHYSDMYYQLVHMAFNWQLGQWKYHTSLLTTTNEALMAIFFLLVGLEVKREVCIGELNSVSKIILPGVAALGGMIVPAIVYLAINWDSPQYLRGWAIPTATDIAFALGVMALLGKKVPLTLKLFLMTLAIFDDIGAIIIITIFYQSQLHVLPLLAAVVSVGILCLCNRFHIHRLWPYLLIGIFVWFFFLESGIHPTLAGVLLALTIPLKGERHSQLSPLYTLEKKLHPWVAYGVLPLFSFTNAGIAFMDVQLGTLFSPLSIGIMLGLWLGKQMGVFGAILLAVRWGWAPMLTGANWQMIYGVALLCGIGFTMSLFIGNLAFAGTDGSYSILVRLGVFAASILSGISGYVLLRWGKRGN